ncbi:MerR family DNA-binding transcriptional regulator [Nocardia seriolae]|uniref:Peroxiredoxin n=1 Tax=Nocardia seriolae TaxID=37332 RepID=A0A0B8NBM0_9NOCA|nr:MerR family DNA-binding transcriptional regulator [Nocardia seriolae]MTJ63617.1 MerR family DNA-binding transcriptional regulator [Nocardia seriolae]MTJ74808.1 MerR family DNA-binding transcriptional regulator [Nocardia seriolae]MTJ88188.1 MerR family DNA-binding transcriptional regulator [Nocardia seriolae]MTK32176.1 MerR family DNA-binding transcriptional regulator [Nocardia seriolae]MTK41517.1 MerR family DNA-binding transcriptional regulator [Nocardia seriolae]
MRIGQLARLAEVSPKAIRRYEALGLVSPARTANGYRDYYADTVRLVREIRIPDASASRSGRSGRPPRRRAP